MLAFQRWETILRSSNAELGRHCEKQLQSITKHSEPAFWKGRVGQAYS